MRLYSDNAQMTSKRGENKEVRDWCSHHVLMASVRYQSTDPRQNGIYLFYTITKTFKHMWWARISLPEVSQLKTLQQTHAHMQLWSSKFIRKNFTNIFKTNLHSRRKYWPQNSVSRFTAICNQLLAITGFLLATYFNKYLLPFHATTKS